MSHLHLTELHRLYQLETQPFRKVHRMIDLFESLIKSHTVVIIAEYVKHNKLSDAAKGMLAQGLRTPSLGTWQLFSRILSEELNADGYAWTFPSFAEAFAALDKALNTTKTNVIAFRNGYAHGATPSDAQCESDILQYEPFMLQLLQSRWLADTSLEYLDDKVWMASATGALCLHPIFLYKEEGGSSPYAFFNDLKNDKVGLLNYPLSKHYREKDFYREFHEYLPLQEWKKTGNNEFQQRIEELTETFKGRIGEREKLLDFVSNNSKGYMTIQGNPGIGKSALIAQFFKDLYAHQTSHHLQVVEYFIRRGTAQAQVEYLFNHLIRRTDELFAQGREIRAEGKAVWDLQQQLFSKWRLWNTHCEGRKLLFLIDGLDEGVENNVVTYMPRENFENILIIYGSRPGGHKSIDELWSQLPVEHHTKLELSGLGKADIRALIYEVANKYEIERESAWIDAVQQRSQGNPLYLKLLCDAMENGRIALNDIHALPKEIDDYYKAILDRYSHDADGDALLAGLFAFAAARDYLTMNHLGLINGIGDATVQRIGSTLKEVLYENPLKEEVLDYQLFHESFREYLMKEKGSRVTEAAERIIDFCAGWIALEGSWEQRYALEHYAFHLSESMKEVRAETLLQLIYDHGYTAAQKKVLQGFDASNEMYRLALKKSCVLKRDDEMLESALCLVDLKYEEANDAPQILAMVANGEIDLALKRIESFGGVDKEGVQRKFILYMLCLMDLTLLGSKDKPFRKSSIEKLLNHLDEQLPTDHSILNWDDFFPSYLIFQMACEWAEMGLDYLKVYRRTNEWDTNWIPLQGTYTELQISIFFTAINHTESLKFKIKNYLKIIDQCIKSKYNKKFFVLFYQLIDELDKIDDKDQQCRILIAVAEKFNDLGRKNESISFLKKALNSVKFINNDFIRIARTIEIYSGFRINQMSIEFSYLIEESISLINCFKPFSKCILLVKIINEYFNQNSNDLAEIFLNDVLSQARLIEEDVSKVFIFLDICEELRFQKKYQLSESLLSEITKFVNEVPGNDDTKSEFYSRISIELSRADKIIEAYELLNKIYDESKRIESLSVILTQSSKSGIFYELDELLKLFTESKNKERITTLLIVEFAKNGKVNEVIDLLKREKEKYLKNNLILNIIKTQSIQKDFYLAVELLLDYLNLERNEISKSKKQIFITSLGKKIYLEKSASIVKDIIREIDDIGIQNNCLEEFASLYQVNGKLDYAQNILNYISDSETKYKSVSILYKNLINDLTYPFVKEISNSTFSDYYKSALFCDISLEMLKKDIGIDVNIYLENAIDFSKKVDENYLLVRLNQKISKIYFKIGNLSKASFFIESAIQMGSKGSDEARLLQLLDIAKLQFNQFLFKECQYTLELISSSFGEIDIKMRYFLLRNALLDLENDSIDDIDKTVVSPEFNFTYSYKKIIQNLFEFKHLLSDEVYIFYEDFSIALLEKGLYQKAIEYANKIDKANTKASILKKIYISITKQLDIDIHFLIDIAESLSNEEERNSLFSSIYVNLIMQNKWISAESIMNKITFLNFKHKSLIELANQQLLLHGSTFGLDFHSNFKLKDLKYFYLRGWAESININDVTYDLSRQALTELVNDSTALEHYLLTYAHHELFFSAPSQEKINRLNKTLNIQWAIDIRSKFLTEENKRNSENVEDWIHAIEDEDDRDQVLLWAKQVGKGKITEADFGEKIKAFI